MILNDSEIEILLELGYLKQDLPQFQEAVKKTVYTYEGKRISAKKAKALLGEEAFLSGLARSAFHWSSMRETADGKGVSFNSSKLFW